MPSSANHPSCPGAPALALARRLFALPEGAMREGCLIAFLAQSDLDHAAPVLEDIRRLGQSGTPPFHVALTALVGAISRHRLSYDLQSRLYTAAKEMGADALAVLLFSGQPELTCNPTGTERSRRELTLGHRKRLARRSPRDQLQRLLADPEQPVIAILLSNPQITEADVTRLAARRPADPEIQRLVFRSRKWSTRHAVKRTLVLNPDTPVELSLRLLSFLRRTDLELITAMPTLPAAVRQSAAQILDERRHPVAASDEA